MSHGVVGGEEEIRKAQDYMGKREDGSWPSQPLREPLRASRHHPLPPASPGGTEDSLCSGLCCPRADLKLPVPGSLLPQGHLPDAPGALSPAHLGPNVLIGGWAHEGEADEENILETQQARVAHEGGPEVSGLGPSHTWAARQRRSLGFPEGGQCRDLWGVRMWAEQRRLQHPDLTLRRGQGLFPLQPLQDTLHPFHR